MTIHSVIYKFFYFIVHSFKHFSFPFVVDKLFCYFSSYLPLVRPVQHGPSDFDFDDFDEEEIFEEVIVMQVL